MNNDLAKEIYCLIKEIENVSSNDDNSEYLKNEYQIDEEIIKAISDLMNKKVSPWIYDLTKGNEIDEIRDNILTDSSKINSYLYSFQIYFDDYCEIIFDELKKYYVNNSITYNEDDAYQEFLEDISNKNINLKMFNQDTRKLINIVFMIDDIEGKCVKLV